MNGRIAGTAAACLLASLAALLAACGGDDGTGVFGGAGSPGPQPARETRTFWATDLATGADYQLQADRVGEGTRCYVYLEQGHTVAQSAIDGIVAAFDSTIHPRTTAAFGSEPSPGIDGDAKIFILLLDIRDGYSGPQGVYVSGYFYPANEFTQAEAARYNLHSNEKEMFYMDIDPGTAGDPEFLRTLAHEFQHMIHFEQKELTYALVEEDWLNEAMSEIAPVYCNYGPDYERVFAFESEPRNSLTTWDGRVEDYGVAYMWAQYAKDRIDPASGNTVFWRMLHRPETGIASVDAALAEIGYGKDFGGVFRDWAVANYSGNALSWPGHPEWSYTSVNTWPGIHPVGGGYAVQLPGMFGAEAGTDCTALSGLGPWSVDYYLYRPVTGNTGSVTWTAGTPSAWASLGDNSTLSYGLVSGTPYAYAGAGYLVVANPSGDNNAGGDGAAFASRRPRPATVAAMLAETARDAAVQRLVAMTGRPVSVCVQPLMREKARRLPETGLRAR